MNCWVIIICSPFSRIFNSLWHPDWPKNFTLIISLLNLNTRNRAILRVYVCLLLSLPLLCYITSGTLFTFYSIYPMCPRSPLMIEHFYIGDISENVYLLKRTFTMEGDKVTSFALAIIGILMNTHKHTHTHTHHLLAPPLHFNPLSYFPNNQITSWFPWFMLSYRLLKIQRIHVMISFFEYNWIIIISDMLSTLKHIGWSDNLWIFSDHRRSSSPSPMGVVERDLAYNTKKERQSPPRYTMTSVSLWTDSALLLSGVLKPHTVLFWQKKSFSALHTYEIKNG